MKTTRRILAAMIITVIFTFSFNTTVFAAEQITPDTQSGVSNTEISDNNIEDQTNNPADSTDDPADTTDDQGPVIDEGQTTDDSGSPNNDGSDADVDEPDITDVPENTVDTPTDVDSNDDSKSNTDNSKDQNIPVVQTPSYSEKDLRLLACLVYAEAGNQSYEGMLAVANVVLNRVKSDVYWHVNTVEEVIYDHKWAVQFAVTIKNKSGLSQMDKALKCYDTGKFGGGNPDAEKRAMNKAIKAAKDALCGKNNIGNYLCFENKRAVNRIKKNYSDYRIIGDHIFYRTR